MVLSVHSGVMADFLPVATVGSIPTVFIGWVVGLVCRGLGLLEFFASVICASVLGFESELFITFFSINSLGVS